MNQPSGGPFALELQGYSIEVADGRLTPALPLNVSVAHGEVVALSGPSGTGKSLALRGLVGLLAAPLKVVGTALGGLSSGEIALVPQDPRWAVLPSDTVRSLVKESARLTQKVPFTRHQSQAPRSAESWFPELFLDLERLEHLAFHVLSGSERVRLLLCLALASPATLIVYDGVGEVLSPLEERRALSLLLREARAGRSALLATRLGEQDLPPEVRVLRVAPNRGGAPPLPLVRRSARTSPPPPDEAEPARAALELQHVSVLVAPAAPNQPRIVAARNLSFSVPRGGSLALLGPPGSGKTALLESIVGLRSQRVGRILLGGEPLPRRAAARAKRHRRALQLVVEEPREALHREHTVRAAFESFARSAARAQDDPESWLERLRLPLRLLDLTPDALSEGEAARVVLGRCLALSPDVLLLDEPRRLGLLGDGLSGDGLSRDDATLLAVLEAERERGMAIVFATSDPTTASLLGDEVAVFHAGTLVELGPTGSVLRGPLHPVTQELALGPRPPAFDLRRVERGCAWAHSCSRRRLDPCATREPHLAFVGSPEERRRVACHYPLVVESLPGPNLED
jgi:peptide/nickel transport system ATP-binding protein